MINYLRGSSRCERSTAHIYRNLFVIKMLIICIFNYGKLCLILYLTPRLILLKSDLRLVCHL